jgi:hypothetical protein
MAQGPTVEGEGTTKPVTCTFSWEGRDCTYPNGPCLRDELMRTPTSAFRRIRRHYWEREPVCRSQIEELMKKGLSEQDAYDALEDAFQQKLERGDNR